MSNKPAAIAVIVSTYKSPQLLRKTLAAYARQSDTNFSIYIADDGSGAEIKQVIDAFCEQCSIPIKHLWHADNGYRRAEIINRAIAAVQEPYILLTDADCVPLPDMVATHRAVAEQGIFIRGSRILLSEHITRQICQQDEWDVGLSAWTWITWRIQGHINRLFPLLMPVGTSSPNQKLPGIRGCHFAFWKDDMLNINGFDSSYQGWGREDSDVAARLFHAGIQRKDLRGMPLLHLWHPEASRKQLAKNDELLQACLDEKRIRACKGIAELDADNG